MHKVYTLATAIIVAGAVAVTTGPAPASAQANTSNLSNLLADARSRLTTMMNNIGLSGDSGQAETATVNQKDAAGLEGNSLAGKQNQTDQVGVLAGTSTQSNATLQALLDTAQTRVNRLAGQVGLQAPSRSTASSNTDNSNNTNFATKQQLNNLKELMYDNMDSAVNSDDNTTYSAGSGVSLSNTTFSTNPGNNGVWSTSGSDWYYNGGKIGVGTTSPVSTLAVSGTTTAQAISVDGDTISDFTGSNLSVTNGTLNAAGASPGGSDGQIQFNDSGSFGGSSDLFWDDAQGRLGIGTSSPDQDLSVSGTSSISDALAVGTTSPDTYLDVRRPDDSGTVAFFGREGDDITSTAYGSVFKLDGTDFKIDTGATGRLITNNGFKSGGELTSSGLDIDAADNYGQYIAQIRQTDSSPSVAGNVLRVRNVLSDDSKLLSLQADDGSDKIMTVLSNGKTGFGDTDPDFGAEIVASTSNGYFGISSQPDNNGDIMTVNPSGKIGIGTTSPASTLAVSGTTTAQAVSVDGDTISDFTGTNLKNDSGNLAVDAGGSAGNIQFKDGADGTLKGTGSLKWDEVNYQLQVTGEITQSDHTNCDLVANGFGDIVCGSSDKNLKTDTRKIDNALSRLRKLDGYTFRFKEDTGFANDRKIGFMAQDVRKVFPELVGSNGEYLTLDYDNMTAILTESIKELDKKVQNLERETESNQQISADTNASFWKNSQAVKSASSTASSTDTNSKELSDTFLNALADALGGVVKQGKVVFNKLTTDTLVVENTVTADSVEAKDKVSAGNRICVDGTCISKKKFKTMASLDTSVYEKLAEEYGSSDKATESQESVGGDNEIDEQDSDADDKQANDEGNSNATSSEDADVSDNDGESNDKKESGDVAGTSTSQTKSVNSPEDKTASSSPDTQNEDKAENASDRSTNEGEKQDAGQADTDTQNSDDPKGETKNEKESENEGGSNDSDSEDQTSSESHQKEDSSDGAGGDKNKANSGTNTENNEKEKQKEADTSNKSDNEKSQDTKQSKGESDGNSQDPGNNKSDKEANKGSDDADQDDTTNESSANEKENSRDTDSSKSKDSESDSAS